MAKGKAGTGTKVHGLPGGKKRAPVASKKPVGPGAKKAPKVPGSQSA